MTSAELVKIVRSHFSEAVEAQILRTKTGDKAYLTVYLPKRGEWSKAFSRSDLAIMPQSHWNAFAKSLHQMSLDNPFKIVIAS